MERYVEDRELYLFHQTPDLLAQQLIQTVPIAPTDIVYEPFRGEGAFFRHFPDCIKLWAEINEGRDYKDFTDTVDWIITNPPYKLNEKNCFFSLVKEFAPRVKKGICFLTSGVCLQSLTPLRLKELEEMGWYVASQIVVNVKKWRGRYYFITFTKERNPSFSYLINNF